MQKQETTSIKQQQQNLWKAILQSKKQLQHPNTTKQEAKFLECLIVMHSHLLNIQLQAIPKVETFIFDVLKPVAREITNFYAKQSNTKKQMRSTILTIIEHYCKIFIKYENINSFQIIRQLLNRESPLFSKRRTDATAAAPARQQQKMDSQQNLFSIKQEEQQKKYKWAKGRLGYTQFHKDCCELIFELIYNEATKVNNFKLNTTKQLINFVYFLEDYIYDQQIYKFALQTFKTLRSTIMLKPTKQQVKQSNKDILQQISQKLLKLLHYHSDKSIKTQITLFGPQFALNLINTQGANMQMKFLGIKILQKFASSFYFRGNQFVKDESFGAWLLKNNLWGVLISKNAEALFVQSSEYILKLLINKSKVSQDKFAGLMNLIWQVKNDLRSMYLKSIDPLKLSYSYLASIMENLKDIKQNPQLFTQEYFYLVECIARYGSFNQTTQTVDLLLKVLEKHFFSFTLHSIKRKSLDSLKYCFQKMIDSQRQFSQKTSLYTSILTKFIQSPSYLTLSISRKIFQSQQKKNSYALQKTAKILIQSRKIIQVIIKQMSKQVAYKDQLMYYLKALLTKYKNYSMSSSLSFSEAILYESLNYPEIFSQLINFSSSDVCEKMFLKVVEGCLIVGDEQVQKRQTTRAIQNEEEAEQKQKQINFSTIRQMFYKTNYLNVEIIEGQYFRPKQYLIKCDPKNLKFMKQIQQILYKCKYPKIQQRCAELICDVYTKFSQVYLQKSKAKLRQFMQNVIKKVQSIQIDNQYFKKQSNSIKLYGNLCLIKELLAATEIHGVNNLKAHNALITTSMIKVKIWNNASYGDDVQKCYQKTVPSNLTMFDLLSKIGEKFKCGQHELYLQQGNNQALPIKMNGYTLLQLGFGKQYKQLNAYKNTKVQLRKQPLKFPNTQTLHPRFITILKQIFKLFANKQNKMGDRQIVNYIQGVTNSSSHIRDSRVANLLTQYDTDKDGYLTEQNFIKFYSDNCDGGDREQNVWNNLINLHYRKDLRKFNEPIDPVDNQNLFRYYLKNSKKSYDLLFKLSDTNRFVASQNSDSKISQQTIVQLDMDQKKASISPKKSSAFTIDIKQISDLSKNILVHLPTCQYFMQASISTLDFLNKNPFEISYIMINIRYFLQKELHRQNKLSKKKQKQGKQKMEIENNVNTGQKTNETNNHQIEQKKPYQNDNKNQPIIPKIINSKNKNENKINGQQRKDSFNEESSSFYQSKMEEQSCQITKILKNQLRTASSEKNDQNGEKKQDAKISEENDQVVQQKQQQNEQKPIQLRQTTQNDLQKQTSTHSQQINYIQRFIQNKNDIKIFQLIKKLSSSQTKASEQQQVLKVVSITILRTLVNLPDLNHNWSQNNQILNVANLLTRVNRLNLTNQDYRFFVDLAKNCLKNGQFTLFEAALALSFLKEDIQWEQWIQQALFHSQLSVKRNIFNFILFFSMKYNFPFNFFNLNIKINPKRCEQYFKLLYVSIIFNTNNVDYSQILKSTLNQIQSQHQDIGPNTFYNQLLNGNLNIARFIITQKPQLFNNNPALCNMLYELFQKQLSKTLCNDNRVILYELMLLIDANRLLDYLNNMIKNIKPTDKYQIKENYVGIKNLGSTCYMNSILQQFFCIESFKEMVMEYDLRNNEKNQINLQKVNVNGFQIVDDFLYQLQKMYVYLDKSKKKYYYPKQFCLTIKDPDQKPINTSLQEDAHEFLNKIFFIMEQYLKKSEKLKDLEQVFQGKTICQISCKDCQNKKQKIQDYYHLSLQVKDLNNLAQSFNKFIVPEIIQDYFCQKCQKKSEKITKQTFLSSTPQILILNLQRIIFDYNTFQKVKVHSKLQFPEFLDLSNYIHAQSSTKAKKYKLKGVVIHSGTSEGGHYYSLIKVKEEWYKFNDQTVSIFNFNDLQRQAYGGASSTDSWGDSQYSTNAYILFYEAQHSMIQEKQKGQQTTQSFEQVTSPNQTTNPISKSQQTIGNQKPQNKSQKQQMKKLTQELKQQLQRQYQQKMKQQPENKPATNQTEQVAQSKQPAKDQNLSFQPSLFQQFTKQVQKQNEYFYQQLQIHQESFFFIINKMYTLWRPSDILGQEGSVNNSNPNNNANGANNVNKNQPNSNATNLSIPFYKQFRSMPLLPFYQKLFSVYFQIIRFISVFNVISKDIFFKIGYSLYQLSGILPHKCQEFLLEKINEKQWLEIMCTNNQQNLRQIYKVVLNKIIYVYSNWKGYNLNENQFSFEENNNQNDENLFDSGEGEMAMVQKINNSTKNQRIKQILLYFLNAANSQTVSKNIFKSYHYFEFWKVNIDCDQRLFLFCLGNDYIVTLLDLLMGNQSPFAKKEKKRQDFPYQVAVPLVQSLIKLLSRKKNLKGAIPFKLQNLNQWDFWELNEKQTLVLSNINFYKKMMKFKYDNGLLASVVYFMCFKDPDFSQKIAELFLIGLNKLQQVQDAYSLLNNIKAFLCVKDEFVLDRAKWILGIWQHQQAGKPQQLQYGLRYSNQSTNVIYVSSRYFICEQKYKPALQVLYDKKNYYTDFEVRGIITLLQILINCDQVLLYVLSIPPPSYIFETYLSWIVAYIDKLQKQDHYGLSFDKGVLVSNMRDLIVQIQEKKQKLLVSQNVKLPALKKIIGKNKILECQQQLSNQLYTIKRWTHQTYVLQNLPQPNCQQNLSIPDQVFSIKQVKSYAKYFVQNNDIKYCDIEQMESMKTITSLTIQAQYPLILRFKLPQFFNTIFINKGVIIVNYPYSEFPLQEYLEIQLQKIEEKQEINNMKEGNQGVDNFYVNPNSGQKMNQKMQVQQSGTGWGDVPGWSDAAIQDYNNNPSTNSYQKACPVCTYLNYMRDKCQMCDTTL